MPVITAQTTIAANKQSNNVLEGSSYEFLEMDSIVRLNMVVQNINYPYVQCLFQIGGITLMQPPFGLVFPISSFIENAAIPNDIYHPYVTRGAPAGSRLFLSFTNTFTTAAVVNWIVRVDSP